MKSRGIAVKVALSVLASAACLYLAARNIEWQRLKLTLLQAEAGPILAGLAISCVSFFLRAQRWQVLLAPFQRIPRLTLFRWHVGGLVVNNIFPLRLGELARAYWAGHKTSLPKAAIFATIVIERAADVISIACISVLLLFTMNLGGASSRNLLAAVLALAAVAGSLAAVSTFPSLRSFLVEKLKALLPPSLSALVESFLSGLKIVRDKKEFAKIASLSLLTWGVDITAITVISRSLDLHLTWIEGGLTISGLILGLMVPAAPGAAGTYEAGGVGALMLLGYDKTLAFSFIFLLHAVQYLFFLVLGLPILVIEGFNPRQLFNQEKQAS